MKAGKIMSNETLKQYVLNYKPKGNREVEIAHVDEYAFTFLIEGRKAIGVVLDMGREPHVYILEEYRGKGYGSRLLKKYIIENGFVGINQYVYYNAGTNAGEKLINSFMKHNSEFKIINVGERKYIILRDPRF